jgi:hypothetical protein
MIRAYRLTKFHLTSIEIRRLRRDLIYVFKMFKGTDNLDIREFFSLDRMHQLEDIH